MFLVVLRSLSTFILSLSLLSWSSEVVTRWCSVKMVFLKISQDLQKKPCAEVYFLIKLKACNFIKKDTTKEH